jgi:hypothetical protein
MTSLGYEVLTQLAMHEILLSFITPLDRIMD